MAAFYTPGNLERPATSTATLDRSASNDKGGDGNDNDEYEGDDGQGTRRGGDEDTKDGVKDEEEDDCIVISFAMFRRRFLFGLSRSWCF